jgi:phosphoglycolate phosphatase-like HAD superfamily hydrolase
VKPLAVFDLDGVLADVSHRVHHVEGMRKNWLAFFAAARHDDVLPEGVALVSEAAKDCEIVYLTGRPERCRRDTLAWLTRHGLPEGDLHMRPDHDRQPAVRLKPKVLKQIAEGRVVATVVDDDLRVCDAYERAGWPVIRATWATRSDALEEAQEVEGRT